MAARIAIALILLLTSLCAGAIAQTKPASQIVITIKRETGLACSPDYSAEIYSDGTVVYHGVGCVKVKGEKRYKISTNKVAQLIKAFEQAGYLSLKDKYEADELGRSWTDSSRTTTSISWNGKYKKVVDYIDPPKKLVALEELIEKLAGLYNYIGPL
ncbi:MAG TPA: DUF6438 domain-containing protein [Pyrinomonadaceae bacterium]|nr:DUF6438 domain-containing protein [Pyrinomonadaceae bacterium]